MRESIRGRARGAERPDANARTPEKIPSTEGSQSKTSPGSEWQGTGRCDGSGLSAKRSEKQRSVAAVARVAGRQDRSRGRVLGPWSVRSGLAGRVAADMSSAARVRGVVLVPMSKPRRQHEVSGVILARLHAALQATSDTWQRCRAPRAAHTARAKPQAGRRCGCCREDRSLPREGVVGNLETCFAREDGKRKKNSKSLVRVSTRIEVVLTSSGSASVSCGMSCGQSIGSVNAVASRQPHAMHSPYHSPPST